MITHGAHAGAGGRGRAAATTIVVVVCLLAASAGAQDASPLILWIVPTDAEFFPAYGEPPTVAQQHRFFDDLHGFLADRARGDQVPREPTSLRVRVCNIRDKTLQDPEFARQVLGQRIIFRELSSFLNGRSAPGHIAIRFLDWSSLLGVLENLPIDHGSARPTPATVASGDCLDPPHVVIAPSTWVAHLAKRGRLLRLDPTNTHIDAYLPVTLETARARRNLWGWLGPLAPTANAGWDLYALPWLVDVRLFFFWKDVFPGAGFADRSALVDALRRARRQDGRRTVQAPFAIPVDADWDLLHTFSLFYWGAGGEWMGPRARFWELPSVLQRDAAANAVDFLKQLRQEHLAEFRPVVRSELERQFLRRELGSLVTGAWMMRRLLDTSLRDERGTELLGGNWFRNIGVTLPPFNLPGLPRTTYLGGSHLALTPRSIGNPHALKLIEYLTGEAARRSAVERVAVPGTAVAFREFIAALPSEVGVHGLLEETIATSESHRLHAGRVRQFPSVPEWASTVEAQATRLELFRLFRHIGEGAASAALADQSLDVLRHRLDWDLYWFPLILTGSTVSVGIAAVVMAAGLWRHRRRRAILVERLLETQRARDAAEHRAEDLDQDMRHLLESFKAREEQLERHAAERGRRDGEIERLTRERDESLQHARDATELQRQLDTLLADRRHLQRALDDAKAANRDLQQSIVNKLEAMQQTEGDILRLEREVIAVRRELGREPATSDRRLSRIPRRPRPCFRSLVQILSEAAAKLLSTESVGRSERLAEVAATAGGHEGTATSRARPAAAAPPPVLSWEPEVPPIASPAADDLTERAAAGNLNPVIGRDEEIALVETVLRRSTRNNPLLYGPAGAGKTAIVEGLAQRIVAGHVAPELRNVRLVQLTLPFMLGTEDTKYRGGFEKQLKTVVEAVARNPTRFILFIDELPRVIHLGAAEGGADTATMLQELWGRGKIRTIGAATLEDYPIITTIPALDRRFGGIEIRQPSPQLTRRILDSYRERYHALQGVDHDGEALDHLVDLLSRAGRTRLLDDAIVWMDDLSIKGREQHRAVVTRHDVERDAERFIGRRPLTVGEGAATFPPEQLVELMRSADLVPYVQAVRIIVERLEEYFPTAGRPHDVMRSGLDQALAEMRTELAKSAVCGPLDPPLGHEDGTLVELAERETGNWNVYFLYGLLVKTLENRGRVSEVNHSAHRETSRQITRIQKALACSHRWWQENKSKSCWRGASLEILVTKAYEAHRNSLSPDRLA